MGKTSTHPYPHGGGDAALTWYARDDGTSVISMRNEEGKTSTIAPANHQDLREYQILEFHRVSETQIDIYRNGIQINHGLDIVFGDDYYFYASIDGWGQGGIMKFD
jgi:hypothetical protein